MKLIREFIIKEIILLIISLLLIQILVDYLLFHKSKEILDTTYNETIDKVVNKTLEASLKFEEFTKNYLSKYLSDLKNIGMHSILFNINTTDQNKKLKNEHKEIYIATLEELNKIDILKDFQKDEENIYINKYDEEFSKITETNIVLKNLFDNTKHPELNTIGYYNPNINDQIDLNEEEQNNIKNMISIFKALYIKRFIMKRKDSDYIRFFIFDKEKMFIYPPTEKNYGSICVRMKYLKNQDEPALVCVEIDFSKLFKTSYLSHVEKYDFGMFTVLGNNTFPIININGDIYDIIIKQFGNTKNRHPLFPIKNCRLFTFYHFFYYNLSLSENNMNKDRKYGLGINWDEIDKEYNITIDKILYSLDEYSKNDRMKYITLDFEKTISQKILLKQGYETVKDEFKMIIVPVSFETKLLNENYLEYGNVMRKSIDIYIYSIISTNPKINKGKLSTIIEIKTINLGYNKNFILSKDKIEAPNKEIVEIKEIYEFMRKILIIKNAFEKENYLKKHNIEFYDIIKDIKKKDLKDICTSFLGFYHFKNKSYSLADSEFHSTILCLQEREHKIMSGNNNEYDDKIKDSIKRSSSESYINEYSTFEKIDENMLLIIKIKILRQRFIYLFAMNKYKLGLEMSKGKNINQEGGIVDKKKVKKDSDKRTIYFKEAINYFNECKKINNTLGINQIKVIYILIMISKCYSQLNDYRQAMNNINEALSLFLEFSKSFKDYHSKNYNPRIMLFIENNIFQYILYTMSGICNQFNKSYSSQWINLKLFETSPFIIGNIHYKCGLEIQNYLEKNKLKLNKSDSKSFKTIALKEIEKTKKYFSKLIPRINAKYLNKNKKSFLYEKISSDQSHSNYSNSYRTKSEDKTIRSNLSSNLKREHQTGKSSYYISVKKNINKIITLCISEKIFQKINGMELKDVIIKYFQKYFVLNDNDKYNFIQFSNNGKKTVYFKMEKLDSFLLKIQKAKNSFELTDTYIINSNTPFMELYNILDSILKSYPPNEENITDNIIILFINSEDIRFQTIGDCIKIVEELKKKNTSIFLLSYDDEIEPEKINNIHSFLNGFFEGYFFQIKNYQQLKQIFINISNIKYQSNFFGYDFDIFDHTL